MKFRNIITVCIAAAAIVMLSVLAFHVRTGITADSVAVLRTTGMTCSSCSNTIKQSLETLKGVAATEVDVEGGWVIVGFDTKTVAPEVLAQKVKTAGFSSSVYRVLTPEQFKQITGRDIGKDSAPGSGCCGSKGGGCNSSKKQG